MALRAESEAADASSSESPAVAATSVSAKPVRRRRLQLSCGECRSKKLSCDRNWPCQRCLKSGRQNRCSFETPTGQPPVPNPATALQQQRTSSNETRQLRAEVIRLRDLLSRLPALEENERHDDLSGEPAPSTRLTPSLLGIRDEDQSTIIGFRPPANTSKSLEHPRNRAARGYYAEHSLFKFFVEIPQLFPFIIETADEWLKPAGVYLKKVKQTTPNEQNVMVAPREQSLSLDILIPLRDDVDALVTFYLDNFEQLHRIVHVPTFKRQYASFWVPGQPRCPATTALILSILALSICASGSSSDPTSVGIRHRNSPSSWIPACEKWLQQQSSKYRKLEHYQVSCLVYLAKRMNMVHKKRFWTETGSLLQGAIIDGLHYDTKSTTDSPFVVEMRRRIWHVIRELDLQNSYEYGLPTLLHNIDSDMMAPANVEDEEFEESSVVIRSEKLAGHYTRTSYQSLSARSWALRLEISRRLFSPAFSQPLTYDDVLHYTHKITEAIADLPAWDSDSVTRDHSSFRQLPVLASAFLQFQLKECVLALHRPYLQRGNSKFWLSENICYNMSRDVLLLNRQLAELGIQSLAQIREDLLLASLNLTRITLAQPPRSTSIIISSSDSIIEILEQCLPIMEERYLRCSNSEPWSFVTMCATSMLLKVHLGKEERQTTKYSCAQRFLALHNRRYGKDHTPPTSEQQQQPSLQSFISVAGETLGACQQPPFQNTGPTDSSVWPDSNAFGCEFNSFDFDMDIDSMWEDMWAL